MGVSTGRDRRYESAHSSIRRRAHVLVSGLTALVVLAASAVAAEGPVQLSRGPYLQMGGPDAVTVRFRTTVPAQARVGFRVNAADNETFVGDPSATTEHAIRLTGLAPSTTYLYSLSTQDTPLMGTAVDLHFTTAPPTGTPAATRLWAIGDSGTANEDARAVYDAYRRFSGSRATDLWLMLGDNAYPVGSDDDFQRAVFDLYPELLRTTYLWTVIGNHETFSGSSPHPYERIFTMPKQGEVGGRPSGSQLYYSFDHANIHFVALDSMVSPRAPDRLTGAAPPMLTWLREDLAANNQPWTIAFFHHPPYSKGNHDSDNGDGLDFELVEMREHVVPILEEHGVDLILSGHSHSYERSFFLRGHHGSSSTFTPAMKRDNGSGRPTDTGAYVKYAAAPAKNGGAVFVVAGSAGQTSQGTVSPPHPAMFVSLEQLGSLVIDVQGDELRGSFLRETGEVRDDFVLRKNVAMPDRVPEAPSALYVAALSGPNVTLKWSHVDGASREDGFIVERSQADAPFVAAAELGANATLARDHIPLGVPMRFRVRAHNPAGLSEASNEVEVVVSRPPPAAAGAPPARPPSSSPGGPAPGPGQPMQDPTEDPTEDAGPPPRSPPPPLPPAAGPHGTRGGGCDCRIAAGAAPSAIEPLIVLGLTCVVARRGRRNRRAKVPAALIGAFSLAASLATVPSSANAHEGPARQLAILATEVPQTGPAALAHTLRQVDLLRRARRFDEAVVVIAAYEQSRTPQWPPPALTLAGALVFADAGQPQAARAQLRRRTVGAPDASTRLARGRLWHRLGFARQAADDLKAAIVALGNDSTPDDFVLLARAQRADRQVEPARETLNRGVRRFGPLVVLDAEAIDLALSRRRFGEALGRIRRQSATTLGTAAEAQWCLRRADVLLATHRPRAARESLARGQSVIAALPNARRQSPAVEMLAAELRTRWLSSF